MTMSEDREIKAVTPAQAVSLLNKIVKTTDENWQRWVAIGRWLNERRAKARAQAKGSSRGPLYAAALEKVLGAFHPHFAKLSNNGTLSYLDNCLEHFAEVEAFRKRLDDGARPGSPAGMWRAYEASLTSTTEFESAEDEVAREDDEKQPKKRGKGDNTKKDHERELLDRIAFLEEKLSEQEMTSDPDMNAQRIFRRMVEVVGHDQAQALVRKTIAKLEALLRRLSDLDEESQS